MVDYTEIEVIDDFCSKEVFSGLEEMIMNPVSKFPWHYNKSINGKDYDNKKDVFQFVHTLYPSFNHMVEDKYMSNIWPVISELKSGNVLRVKANCIPRTEKIVKHGLHNDFIEKDKNITTAILYMNTNNGYTRFKDKTRVNSKANRIVKFPYTYLHGGTTCTDEHTRVVVNFNFLKQ